MAGTLSEILAKWVNVEFFKKATFDPWSITEAKAGSADVTLAVSHIYDALKILHGSERNIIAPGMVIGTGLFKKVFELLRVSGSQIPILDANANSLSIAGVPTYFYDVAGYSGSNAILSGDFSKAVCTVSNLLLFPIQPGTNNTMKISVAADIACGIADTSWAVQSFLKAT